jgi:hypothetical protein
MGQEGGPDRVLGPAARRLNEPTGSKDVGVGCERAEHGPQHRTQVLDREQQPSPGAPNYHRECLERRSGDRGDGEQRADDGVGGVEGAEGIGDHDAKAGHVGVLASVRPPDRAEVAEERGLFGSIGGDVRRGVRALPPR